MPETAPAPTLAALRAAVECACQPQGITLIEQGRAAVLAMPRDWVRAHLAGVAEAALDLSDEWEYRRLLELLDLLDDVVLLRRFVTPGLSSADKHIRQAAEDFQTPGRFRLQYANIYVS
jgi:hypothetical protein